MRTAIYARVSTTDKGQDTMNQLTQLRTFGESLGSEIVVEFIDNATGGNSDRPAFKAMFAAAERKEFDLLLFWSLDRLSREGVLPTLNHLNRLDSYGIAYKSLTEQYLDSCGLFKDAIISIMATLAKQEKIRISERTKAGLATARSRGKRLGQKPSEFDRQKWSELRSLGLSNRACARELQISESTLRRALKAA